MYDVGVVLPMDLGNFRLRITGALENPLELSWQELLGLPKVEATEDFHCVDGWSVRGLRWEGVPTRVIVDLVRPKVGVQWVMAYGREGYSTSVPYGHLLREGSLLAWGLNGQPLPPEHGSPLRLVVPSLYAWKSAKYLTGLEFLTEHRRGYWEERGYHDVGDPWQEERYAKDRLPAHPGQSLPTGSKGKRW